MLTGDRQTVAQAVAAELGIDEVRSELMPGDKVAAVEEILAKNKAKLHLSETASTTRQFCRAQTSASLWGQWDRTLLLKLPT